MIDFILFNLKIELNNIAVIYINNHQVIIQIKNAFLH